MEGELQMPVLFGVPMPLGGAVVLVYFWLLLPLVKAQGLLFYSHHCQRPAGRFTMCVLLPTKSTVFTPGLAIQI